VIARYSSILTFVIELSYGGLAVFGVMDIGSEGVYMDSRMVVGDYALGVAVQQFRQKTFIRTKVWIP